MAIENLLEEIRNDAEQEVKEIISDAKREAEKLIKNAEQDAEKKASKLREEAERNAEIAESRIVASAKRNARIEIMKARDEIINRVIDEMKEKLKKIKGKKYRDYVEKAIENGKEKIGKIYIMAARKEDEKVAKEMGVEVKGKVDAIGGVIIKSIDGKKEIDATFDALLKRRMNELRIKISERLWE